MTGDKFAYAIALQLRTHLLTRGNAGMPTPGVFCHFTDAEGLGGLPPVADQINVPQTEH
jgi:hypothetical protein